jgi:nucleoside-diphosphate-sugar epimerase
MFHDEVRSNGGSLKPKPMFTIFGAAGWVGSALARRLTSSRYEVRAVSRDTWPAAEEALGHVIYAIGLTADFREHPLAATQAHVATLLRALEYSRFESFLYLSSTRVYLGAGATAEETALSVRPADPDNLYNVSKLAGEAVCLALPSPSVRVVRLSNVLGVGDHSQNFLAALLAEARTGAVTIRSAADSEKDYVALEDVTALLEAIALRGRYRIYNVASGRNVTNRLIAELLRRHTGAEVTFAPGAPRVSFPPIAIERVAREFGAPSTPFERVFAELVKERWGTRDKGLPILQD